MATYRSPCTALTSLPTNTSWRCNSVCSTTSMTAARSRAMGSIGLPRQSLATTTKKPGRSLIVAKREYMTINDLLQMNMTWYIAVQMWTVQHLTIAQVSLLYRHTDTIV